MPLVPKTNATSLDKARRFMATERDVAAQQQQGGDALSFGQEFQSTFLTETFLGSAIKELRMEIAKGLTVNVDKDPDFDPFEWAADRVRSHPFLEQDIRSGEIADLQNRRHAEFFLMKRLKDRELHERAKQASFGAHLAGQIPEFLATAGLVSAGSAAIKAGQASRVAALAGTSRSAARAVQAGRQALTSGGRLARVGKTALAGAAGNLAQEAGIEAINPDRPVDEQQRFIEAGLGGLFFGGALGGVAEGMRGFGHWFGTTRGAQRLKRDIARGVTERQAKDAAEWENNQVAELQRMLDEDDAAGDQSLVTLRTERTEPLIKQLQQKWADAGHQLHIQDHPSQGQFDLGKSLERLDELLKGRETSEPGSLGNSRLDRVAQRTVGAWSKFLSNPLPGGRFRNAITGPQRMAARTFFDDLTPTREAAESPLTHSAPPAAEALDDQNLVRLGQANQAVEEEFQNAAQRKLNVDLGNGQSVNVQGARGRQEFHRLVSRYIWEQSAVERGLRDQVQMDAPEPIVNAANKVRENFMQPFARDMVDVGMFQNIDEAQHYLNRRYITPEIEKRQTEFEDLLVDDFFNRIGRDEQGRRLNTDDRPLVAEVLDQIDDQRIAELRRPREVEAGAADQAGRAERQPLGIDLNELPTGRFTNAPDELINRELFSFNPGDVRLRKGETVNFNGRRRRFMPGEFVNQMTMVPREATDVIDAVNRMTDETWRLDGTQGRGMVLLPKRALQTLRDRGVDVDTRLKSARQAAEQARADRQAAQAANPVFDRMTRPELVDDLRTRLDMQEGVNEKQVIEAAKRSDDPNDALFAEALEMMAETGQKRRLIRVNKLDEGTELRVGDNTYTVTRETDPITGADELVLKSNKGQTVPIDQQTTMPTERIVKPAEDTDVIGTGHEVRLRDVTESDLPADLRETYRQRLDEFARRLARSTSDNLLQLNNRHGVHAAAAGGPFRSRKMDIDEVRFAEAGFLADDVQDLLSSYHHKVSGELAARRAIKKRAEYWQPIVEDYTGKDLAAEAYSPDLVLETLRKIDQDVRRLSRERGFGDEELNQIDLALKRTNQLIEAKQAELRKFPTVPGNEAAEVGTGKLLGDVGFRVLRRLTSSAFLGRVLLSTMIDSGMVVSRFGMRPRTLLDLGRGMAATLTAPVTGIGDRIAPQATAQTIGRIRVPKAGVEAMAQAMEESADRMQNLTDVLDVPFDPKLQGTRLRRNVARVDRATDLMQRKFFELSLMNRWNQEMKRITARLETREVFQRSRQMAQARRLMNEGMSEGEALRKAGINRADAAEMSEAGIDGQAADEFIQLVRQHGEDAKGRPFSDYTDEEFANYKGLVNPRYDEWADQNPELFETVTAGINSRVRDIIIQPKLSSRPKFTRQNKVGQAMGQFLSFAFSFANQFLPAMSNRTASQMAQYALMTIPLAATSDALHNHLNGNRDFGETLDVWRNKPEAMIYQSILRAGAASYLERPLMMMDRHTAFGPGKLLGETRSSLHSARSLSLAGNVGAPFDYLERGLRATSGLAQGDFSHDTLDDFRRITPMQNLIWLSGIYRMTHDAGVDNPFGIGKGIDLFPLPTLPRREATERERKPRP